MLGLPTQTVAVPYVHSLAKKQILCAIKVVLLFYILFLQAGHLDVSLVYFEYWSHFCSHTTLNYIFKGLNCYCLIMILESVIY